MGSPGVRTRCSGLERRRDPRPATGHRRRKDLVDDDGPIPVDLSTLQQAVGFMKAPEPTVTPLFYLMSLFEKFKFVGVEVEKIKGILQERVHALAQLRRFGEEDVEGALLSGHRLRIVETTNFRRLL